MSWGTVPEYKKCNPVTLINRETGEFATFHKNAHEQLLITDGNFYGLTYKVGETNLTDKDSGNAKYIELRKAGWIRWQDYCLEKGLYIGDYGYYLF